jgi:hypothetical protein
MYGCCGEEKNFPPSQNRTPAFLCIAFAMLTELSKHLKSFLTLQYDHCGKTMARSYAAYLSYRSHSGCSIQDYTGGRLPSGISLSAFRRNTPLLSSGSNNYPGKHLAGRLFVRLISLKMEIGYYYETCVNFCKVPRRHIPEILRESNNLDGYVNFIFLIWPPILLQIFATRRVPNEDRVLLRKRAQNTSGRATDNPAALFLGYLIMDETPFTAPSG